MFIPKEYKQKGGPVRPAFFCLNESESNPLYVFVSQHSLCNIIYLKCVVFIYINFSRRNEYFIIISLLIFNGRCNFANEITQYILLMIQVTHV